MAPSAGLESGAAVLAAALDRLPRRRPTLAVLTYHRVAPADERPELHPGIRVDPEAFAAHLGVLTRHAQPVSCDDLLAACAGDRPLPARAVHVTLDDGYGCTERHAWPALRAAGVPATLFVPTAYPDTTRTFWWDRLHHALRGAGRPSLAAAGRRWPTATAADVAASFRALRAEVAGRPPAEGQALVDEISAGSEAGPLEPDVADWDALTRMATEGLALAPHSRTHPFLPSLSSAGIEDEVGGSWADLVDRVGPRARPLFAAPGGASDGRVRAAAARAGLSISMTTERGVNDGVAPRWDQLRRVNVGPGSTEGLVRLQLHPTPHRARAGALAARSRVRASLPARGGQTWS
ncbi:polysaccharide deacetylase family protein [Iamia sp. SCSIO 61187]|uniref:polysaccharide deacetylase family protein n=1 Tax=Iamia sp. SCSIO 61187 TaxID=2722752 RepID=UPI001C62BC67|nr:polysaccharide deacetylase family protein [Iamia sp. SCSIO 61187]QYG92252.1 polysaccharide deacetylase family protein [Iamia sp. SCSIO 61187]